MFCERLIPALGLICVTCGPAMRPARTSAERAPSERELESARRVRDADCGPAMNIVFPGITQMCQGRPVEGAVLTSLGAAELGTGVAVGLSREEGFEGFKHPGAIIPLVAYQNLWGAAYVDAVFEEQRAAQKLYVPEDTLGELVIAPFNANVVGQLDVWLGTLGILAVGIGTSALVDENITTTNVGDDANLFGRDFSPATGYPLAGGVGAALFSHVAIGEEMFFRGMLQGHMSRETDPTSGWIGASVVFGVAHAPNSFALPSDQRGKYLAIGVPFITLLGSYLGLSYRWHDYSLAAPVAIHFWYDFLLTATFFALDPQSSPLAASVSIPF